MKTGARRAVRVGQAPRANDQTTPVVARDDQRVLRQDRRGPTWIRKEMRPGASVRPARHPLSIMVRGSSRCQGPPLPSRGAIELHRRPRALAVRWGHERLVGCRALEPCH